VNIQWEFQRQGESPPEIWTINRVIKRNKLKRKPVERVEKASEYPIQGWCRVQQMDFVGPRYIKNYGRFYWLNIMDLDMHKVGVYPTNGKSVNQILPCIVRFWQEVGIPDYLQMDNELSFHGSNRHPHGFGRVIRFALSQGVTVIFIPVQEPWRNGVIEKFNDTFDKKFFRKKTFNDFESIVKGSQEFMDFHNEHHRYAVIGNRTPNQECVRLSRSGYFLSSEYKLPKILEYEEGEIILVRFIRSDRKLMIFSEVFLLPEEMVYSYVTAIIVVKIHRLKVYRDGRQVVEFNYQVPSA